MSNTTKPILRPYDRDALRARFTSAEPFPHMMIDGFLEPEFARQVADSYPSFEAAAKDGRVFRTVNEKLKLQMPDSKKFPEPVRLLHEALASPAFLADLEHITGIQNLLADPALDGGGIHMTGPGGRLDVHVDFNIHETTGWHRRLNILVYLNEGWQPSWGGEVELWDAEVKRCWHSFSPVMNRCVLFNTHESSYHGVQPLKAPPGIVRKSFAAYYYTKEPPLGWDGKSHSTVFRARPTEKAKGWLWMPLEKALTTLREQWRSARRKLAGK